MRVDGPHEVTALVWERGAGETSASGSSAVAVASAAIANGWCESPVTVQMPGGELRVELDEENRLTLVGPAEEICVGEARRLDGELELAEHVVQAQLLVVRLLAPADDQRAGELVGAGRELLRPRPRHDDGARRHGAAVLDRLRRRSRR